MDVLTDVLKSDNNYCFRFLPIIEVTVRSRCTMASSLGSLKNTKIYDLMEIY